MIEDKKKDAHYDHPRNVRQAKVFIENSRKTWPGGMRVYIADSECHKDHLMWFSFQPEFGIKHGVYAYVVDMHQDNKTFRGEAGASFVEVKRIATEYWVDHPEPTMIQPEMGLESPRIDLLT